MMPGIFEPHHLCPESGALIFPRSTASVQEEENAILKAQLAVHHTIITALLSALPQTTVNKLTSDHLEAFYAYSADR